MTARTTNPRMDRLAEAARAFHASRRAMRSFIRRYEAEELAHRRLKISASSPIRNNRFNRNDGIVDLN